MDNTAQFVLEWFTVFEGVLLLQVLCTADGELYIVINIGVFITHPKPSSLSWVFYISSRPRSNDICLVWYPISSKMISAKVSACHSAFSLIVGGSSALCR